MCVHMRDSSLLAIWRPLRGREFYVESIVEIEKCKILQPEEKMKENVISD